MRLFPVTIAALRYIYIYIYIGVTHKHDVSKKDVIDLFSLFSNNEMIEVHRIQKLWAK